MTDEDRKILTKFAYGVTTLNSVDSLPSFDTWQDLGDLKNMLVAEKELSAFLESAFESDLDGDGNSIEDLAENARADGEKFYNPDFIDWILSPPRFCQLVADYLRNSALIAPW